MKVFTYIAFIISLSFLVQDGIAQRIKIEEDTTKDSKAFREAKKYVRKGNRKFRKKDKGSAVLAVDFYKKAYKYNPENIALNYKLGKALLRTYPKREAKNYLEKVSIANDSIKKDFLLDMAQAYQYNYNFDQAVEKYNEYKTKLKPKKLLKIEHIIDKKIQECESGKIIVVEDTRVIIEDLGASINTIYPEYRPSILPDESELYFTSRRPGKGNTKKSPIDKQYFEDIYASYKSDTAGFISENIGRKLNSKNNDAIAGIYPDGQQIVVFKGKFGGDLYVSKKKGSKWKKPKQKYFKRFINTRYTESSVSITFDNRYLFFVSDRKDLSYGGKDIYMSKWNTKRNRWEYPINLGDVINTPYDEEGVFIHPDGKTLYFSSKGHNTMGGYDIFQSIRNDDGSWTKPENLGYPINSTDDDAFLVVNANGRIGYYSSIGQDSAQNFDIYKVIFLGPEKPLILSSEDNLIASIAKPISESTIEKSADIKTIRLTILKGVIQDALSKEPLEAAIEVIDNEKNEQILTSTSNSSTGKYLISLPSGKNYGIAIAAKDYLFHSENLNIPPATDYQEITKDIPLYKIEAGSKIVLANIFFEFGKATLSPESTSELERVVKFLNAYSSVTIEISGHTDNIGSLSANTRISENRAKSVVDHLIEKGIPADRLEYKGYAFEFPVASNDTEEGRMQNRRVEFKILSK